MAMPDQLAGLRRGLGRDGQPIPAYQSLGLEFRSATAGAAVVRLPVVGLPVAGLPVVGLPVVGLPVPQLAPSAGGLLPGAFAVVADACCGSAVASALPAGGAALTAQLRVEFIRPGPPGHAWIEGRARADAVDDDGGLARGEIVDEAGQLLGVASLRLMRAPDRGRRGPAAAGHGGHPVVASAVQGAGVQGAGVPAAGSAGDPVRRFLGVVGRRAGAGRSAWTLRPSSGTANSYGMVHGGVLGLLAHQVASDAQRSLLVPGEQLVPLDLVVNFYRAVPASGRLIAATAQVTHRGRRFVVAEGEVAGADGQPALRLSAGAQVRGAGSAGTP